MFSLSAEVLAQTGILEEVKVTAQKREESIQDVGIAITAFSGEQLDAFGFVNNTGVAAFTPGVHISGNNAGHTQQFTIRGATQNDFADIAEAPNAVYVDEAYQATGQSHLFANYDMERVEILKGPQGTLFGRNATGGLVRNLEIGPFTPTVFIGLEGLRSRQGQWPGVLAHDVGHALGLEHVAERHNLMAAQPPTRCLPHLNASQVEGLRAP